jgi:hypothetical protein
MTFDPGRGHQAEASIECMSHLPVAAYRLSGALAVVALVAAATSFFIPDARFRLAVVRTWHPGQ